MPAVPRRSAPFGRLLTVSGGIVCALTLARLVILGPTQAFLDQVSGVWTALAVDLASGVFYRPVVGPDGYGGTRYFPLFFVLHAGAIRLFGHPVLMGQILNVVSVCALVAGAYWLLRAMGVGAPLAAPGALAVLVSQPTQTALLSIREDAFPAALNMLGLALCARQDVDRRRVLGAALLFTLAFAAKSSSVFGVCTAGLWLTATKRGRLASAVLAATTVGIIGVGALMQVASAGRAFDVLWAGSAAGVGVGDLLQVPLRIVVNLRGRPETLLFVLLGIAATLALVVRRRGAVGVPVLLFAATFLCTVPIFAFEGTGPNHLIDIHAASVVAIVACVADIASTGAAGADIPVGVLGGAMLVGSFWLTTGLFSREVVPVRGRGTFAQTVALIPDRRRLILSDNPLGPIAAGQRPYLLDPYLFRLMRERREGFDAPLLQALREQQFAAVVLERDPSREPGRTMYQTQFIGGAFVETLDRYYEQTGSVGRRVILTPRPR